METVNTHYFNRNLTDVCRKYKAMFLKHSSGRLSSVSADSLLQDLQHLLTELDLEDKPDRLYSCGEVEITKVFDTREVTTQLCVSSVGKVLPSLVVYSKEPQKMLQGVNKPASWFYGTSKSGNVTCDLFYRWFNEVFLHHCSPTKPVLLLVDPTKMSAKLYKKAKMSQVELFLIPSNFSLSLQPVHCGLLQSLQHFYNSLCSQPGFQVSKEQFPVVWYTCIHSVLTPHTVQSAFTKSRISRTVQKSHSDQEQNRTILTLDEPMFSENTTPCPSVTAITRESPSSDGNEVHELQVCKTGEEIPIVSEESVIDTDGSTVVVPVPSACRAVLCTDEMLTESQVGVEYAENTDCLEASQFQSLISEPLSQEEDPPEQSTSIKPVRNVFKKFSAHRIEDMIEYTDKTPESSLVELPVSKVCEYLSELEENQQGDDNIHKDQIDAEQDPVLSEVSERSTKKKKESREVCRKNRVLTPEEEKDLAAYILYMCEGNCPLARKHVKLAIREMIRQDGPERVSHSVYIMERGPSSRWFLKYLKRHDGLSPDILNIRHLYTPAERAKLFYNKYERILDKQSLRESPYNIFCCNLIKSQDDQMITLLTCASASGTLLPCLMVFQGKVPGWSSGHHLPANWLYTSSTSGCLTEHLFLSWFVEVFLRSCGSARPVVLLLTTNEFYSFRLYKLAAQHQVQLLYVSADTEEKIHPLCGRWCENLITEFRDQCQTLFKTLDEISLKWEVCLNKQNNVKIQEAFAESGIYPFKAITDIPCGKKNRKLNQKAECSHITTIPTGDLPQIWRSSHDGSSLEELTDIQRRLQAALERASPQTSGSSSLGRDGEDTSERLVKSHGIDITQRNGKESLKCNITEIESPNEISGNIRGENGKINNNDVKKNRNEGDDSEEVRLSEKHNSVIVTREEKACLGKKRKHLQEKQRTDSHGDEKMKPAIPPCKKVKPAMPPRKKVKPAMSPFKKVKPAMPPCKKVKPAMSPCKKMKPAMSPCKKMKPAICVKRRANGFRTLRSRFGTTKSKENIRFTVVQEQRLCQYLIYLKHRNYPLQYGELRTAAYVFASEERAIGRECGIEAGRAPSMNWCEKFCSSQPSLQAHCIVGRSKDMTQRAALKPCEILAQFYSKYEDILIKHKLEDSPSQIFVCVDIELPISSEETVTSLLCVSASGKVLPSFLIFKDHIPAFEREDQIMKKWMYAFSSTGLLDPELFYVWFLNILSRQTSMEKTDLLLLEPHNQAYFSLMEATHFYRVELLYLPVEALHRVNPLRQSVVKQLVSTFSSLTAGSRPLTPSQVPVIWSQCLQQTDLSTLTTQAFRETGLYPSDRAVVDQSDTPIERPVLSAKSPFIPWRPDVVRVFTGKKLRKMLSSDADHRAEPGSGDEVVDNKSVCHLSDQE